MRHMTVSTTHNCSVDDEVLSQYIHDPSWRHNMIGCAVMTILQDIHHFNITYVMGSVPLQKNVSVDVYANPMTLRADLLEIANPVQTVLLWRFGFILRRPHSFARLRLYYVKPFTTRVWDCLTAVAFIATMLFFLMSWWEKRLVGGRIECSLALEMLFTVGGYCQHVFPVETILFSRRTAHLTFFLYAYIIYNVYTSNLLSHLVNDNDNNMQLRDLGKSNFQYVTFSGMKSTLIEYSRGGVGSIRERIDQIKLLSVDEALDAVRDNKAAFLSDYHSVYSTIRNKFSDSEICDLIEIDLRSKVRKYIFASKTFRYTQELKINTLRAIETGVLQRLISFDEYMPVKCDAVLHQEVRLAQIIGPLLLLASTYATSVIILILERLHYNRNRLWPYIE